MKLSMLIASDFGPQPGGHGAAQRPMLSLHIDREAGLAGVRDGRLRLGYTPPCPLSARSA